MYIYVYIYMYYTYIYIYIYLYILYLYILQVAEGDAREDRRGCGSSKCRALSHTTHVQVNRGAGESLGPTQVNVIHNV